MSVRAQTIGRNFTILSVGQVGARLVAFAVTVHLAHVLPVDRFGVIVFAAGVLLYTGLVSDAGLSTLGPLEVARHDIPVHALAQAVLSVRLLLAVLVVATLSVALWFVPTADLTKLVLVLYLLSLLTTALDLSWVFLGTELMWPVAVTEITSQAIQAAGAFLLVQEPDHLARMPVILLVAQAVTNGLLLVLFMRRYGRIRLGLDRTLLRRLLPAAFPLAGSAAVSLISANFDLILLGLWLGAEAAGLYGAAYRVVWMPVIITTAFYTALRPTLARAGVAGFHTVEALFGRMWGLATAFGIGVAVGGIVLAAPLVNLLYGHAYHQAVQPLRILLLSFALLGASRSYRLVLIAFKRQAAEFRVMLIAAIVNIIANVLLIPRFGLSGAAFATVLGECVALIGTYWATRRMVGHTVIVSYLAKLAPCAGILAISLMITESLHIVARLGIGACVYTMMLVMLRVVTVRDIRLVCGAFQPIRRDHSGPRARYRTDRVTDTHVTEVGKEPPTDGAPMAISR